MQPMAVKDNTGWCNSKECAKRVLFKANFAVFWAPKQVVEPTTWVQNPLGCDQRRLFIISVGSNAKGHLQGHARHPNCPKRSFFWATLDKF